jgi:hypothetical protein
MANQDDMVNVGKGISLNLGQLVQAVKAIFPIGGATSTTATAGSATLPDNPLGFLSVTLPDGTAVKIPYYNP